MTIVYAPTRSAVEHDGRKTGVIWRKRSALVSAQADPTFQLLTQTGVLLNHWL